MAVLAAGVVAVGAQLAFALISSSAGTPAPRPLGADSIVTDSAGNVIAELHPPGETRLPVPLGGVAATEQQAIVAVEDHSFWTEGPIDVGRLVASVWQDIRHDNAQQGASTIPMQLAKVLYLTDDKSLDYKLRQVGLAGHLVSTMSKQQILEAYLNDVFFGEGATGIEAASHVYFGIPASKLDLAQAAMLAGLPNAPSLDDPIAHPAAAAARQQTVLAAMVSNQEITQAQADAAAAEKLSFAGPQADDIDTQPAFVARVVGQLTSQLHVDPERDGLRITATLVPGLQQYAALSVHKQVEAVGRLSVSDGALVSVDPRTGAVVAYVGSAGVDPASAQIDMAAAGRQPGSTFKLFTYSTALAERRITMVTPVLDAPLTFPTGSGPNGLQPWSPLDYDRTWHGVLPVAEAFANSLNIPAIRTELVAGIPQVLATARSLGVTTLGRTDSSHGPSLTLGTYPIPLWQMAQAATAFANQGKLQPVTFVSSVKDGNGVELYHGAPPRQAIDPGAAEVVNKVLTNDHNRELEFGLNSDLTLPGHVVAAKTGTSEDFRDNFTVGWTPHLVTATWVGNANDSPMRGTTGITGAAPIWHTFMLHALAGVADNWPSPPAGVHETSVAGYGPAWFLSGTSPQTGVGLLGAGPDGAVTSLPPLEPTPAPSHKKHHHR
jgi:membrane peptidoglycan carboxypeptidase